MKKINKNNGSKDIIFPNGTSFGESVEFENSTSFYQNNETEIKNNKKPNINIFAKIEKFIFKTNQI